jgi:hypothetical protein
MRERRPLVAQGPLCRLIIAGLIVVGDLLAAEVLDERAIPAAFGAMRTRSRIELAMWQRIEDLSRPRENERAAVETEGDGNSIRCR